MPLVLRTASSWRSFLVLTLLMPMLSVTSVRGSSIEDNGECLVAYRSSEELIALIDDTAEHPPKTKGNLPPAYGTSAEGASYEVSGEKEVSLLRLDGRNLFGQLLNPLADFGAVPFNDLAQIVALLGNWSTCVREIPDSTVLSGFLTDHALTWVYATGDPFHVQESPAAGVYSPSSARSIGSLPLIVTDAGALSDGRIAVMIVEGWALREDSEVLGPYVPASLWLFDHTDRGWMIDGIVGGFMTSDTDWIVV